MQVKPDELYNLGAQSHVKVSFEMSEYTADTDGMGVGFSRCPARLHARTPR